MSILGNPILIGGSGGGGGTLCAVELHGGPGETVTWSDGVNTGTVTLSGTGDGGLTLPAGGYTFTFSLGNVITGAHAITITPGITTVVTGWGNRIPAYWFGRDFGFTETITGTAAVRVANTNYYWIHGTAGSGSGGYKTFVFNDVPISSNTQAKAYIDKLGNYGSGEGYIYGTSIANTNTYTGSGDQLGVYMLGLVSGSGNTTLGFRWNVGGSSGTPGLNMYAIWLE